MSLSLYKPTQKNTGCGFSFQLGINNKTQESALYIKAIKQHSWDETKRQGYFHGNSGNPDKNIVVKFNEYEIGNLIHSLISRIEYTTFHSFNEDKTVIKLAPWDKKAKKSAKNHDSGEWEEVWVPVKAYSLSFVRNGNQSFSITLEPGEACSINEYLKFSLQKIYGERFDKEQKDIKSKKYKDQTRPPF
tara:strand:+ start:134 stop:700 length:567 start_codon:yes stop_codon:yes gene_type:complete